MLYQLSRGISRYIAGLPGPYWLLWAGTLLNRLGTFVFPFMTIYLTTVRGLSISQATFVVALIGLGSFSSALVGGMLSDQVGRRATMVGGFCLASIMMVCMGFAQSLVLITALALPLGFFTDLYRPASAAAVADLVEPALRRRAFSLLYWVINLGAAVAPIVAGIVARISYLVLFIADALTTLLFAVLIWFGVPETRPQINLQAQEKRVGHGLRVALHDPRLLIFTMQAFLFACIYFQGYVTLPVDMQMHGLGSAQYGLAIGMNGLVIVALSIPINELGKRFSASTVLAASASLLGLGFGLVLVIHTLPWYMLSVIVWTIGELLGSPVVSTLLAEMAPLEHRGTYQGIAGAAWGLASAAGPIFGGLVLEHFGAETLWIGCLLLGVVVAASYLVLGRSTRKHIH